MDLKPIYVMTEEEFDEFERMSDAEREEYLMKLFEVESEKFIEIMHKSRLNHVGKGDARRIQAELIAYGAEEWIKLCDE